MGFIDHGEIVFYRDITWNGIAGADRIAAPGMTRLNEKAYMPPDIFG
jgi:hypothetical protein